MVAQTARWVVVGGRVAKGDPTHARFEADWLPRAAPLRERR